MKKLSPAQIFFFLLSIAAAIFVFIYNFYVSKSEKQINDETITSAAKKSSERASDAELKSQSLFPTMNKIDSGSNSNLQSNSSASDQSTPSNSNLPRSPLEAALKSEWKGSVQLSDVALVFEPQCRHLKNTVPVPSVLRDIRENFSGESEFSDKDFTVRWDMMFGPPDTAVLLRASWLGEVPRRYQIEVQDAREAKKSGNSDLMFTILEKDLNWEDAKKALERLKKKYLGEFEKITYRRMMVELDAPVGQSSEAGNKTVEVLNDRVLLYQVNELMCQSSGRYELTCSCQK